MQQKRLQPGYKTPQSNGIPGNNIELLMVEDIDPSNPKMGGIATYTHQLLGYLSKAGIKVTVLGVSNGNGYRGVEGITFTPVIHKIKYSGYEYLLKLILKAPFLHIPKSVIIHAHHPGNMLPFSLFHKKNPKILTIHGQVLEKIRLKRNIVTRFIYQLVESYVLKHVDIIIAVDEVTGNFYQKRYPWMAKPKIIPTGIDLDRFKIMDRSAVRKKYGFKPGDKIIAYIGRLEKEKGLELLLDCLVKVKKAMPETVILFVGDGRDRRQLENHAERLNLDRVFFLGMKEPEIIPEIINCADVLALCSVCEGSPMVVKEALACGVPVISTNVGDVCQLIRNEKTGKIVPRDEDEFAHALIDVLRAGDREKISKECVSVAAGYSIDLTCSKIVALYKGLGNNKKNQYLGYHD